MGWTVCCSNSRGENLLVIFTETYIKDLFVIGIQKLEDERGFFARAFCKNEFIEHGLNPNLVQCNISYNKKKGTLRGMHFQAYPNKEAKMIRCLQGSIYDVVIDLRSKSNTFMNFFGITLEPYGFNMLYIPEDFAHGFLTLEDDTIVFYQMSEFFAPDSSRGFRWDDPSFNIKWPIGVEVISQRDSNYPDFSANLLTCLVEK